MLTASLLTCESVYVQMFRVACSLLFFCVSFCHVVFMLSVSVLVVLSFVLTLLMFCFLSLALSVFMLLPCFQFDSYCACFFCCCRDCVCVYVFCLKAVLIVVLCQSFVYCPFRLLCPCRYFIWCYRPCTHAHIKNAHVWINECMYVGMHVCVYVCM